MKLNQTYEVNIEGYDMNGYGYTHLENKIVFVEGALKDEKVICEIINIHKSYCFAKTIKIIEASKNRIEANCKFFGLCGGCDLQHMDYETELLVKENKLRNTLKKNIKYNSIIQSDKIMEYRNKVMVPFKRDEEDDDVIYGFYEKKSHKIIPMDKCIVSSSLDNQILYFIRGYLSLFHISIYDEETHTGIFKEVMIRHTKYQDTMVVLVVTKEYDFSKLVQLLTEEFEQIKSIYLNINSFKTNVVLSNQYKLLYGAPTILEEILDLKFEVSPSSFLQVNHNQCEKLYLEAMRMANLNKNMYVIDAFCGMGSITLNIARHVKYVYGIEVVESAIENANRNKELNKIFNATFICGKCEDEIVRLSNKENIDVIFFDPPRKGCDEKFLNTVISMKIPKIIYISCNVATMARDIEYLEKHNYTLIEATPVDLFSRTSHIETICQLSLRDETKHNLYFAL